MRSLCILDLPITEVIYLMKIKRLTICHLIIYINFKFEQQIIKEMSNEKCYFVDH